LENTKIPEGSNFPAGHQLFLKFCHTRDYGSEVIETYGGKCRIYDHKQDAPIPPFGRQAPIAVFFQAACFGNVGFYDPGQAFAGIHVLLTSNQQFIILLLYRRACCYTVDN